MSAHAMSGTGAPTVLDHPVWYEPLRSPSWLLPKLREDAPRVVFTIAEGADEANDVLLRDGLAMFLADAIRYSTDARTIVAFDPHGGDGAIRATIEGGNGDGAAFEVHVRSRSGDDLGSVVEGHGSDEASTGGAIAALPGALVGALRSAGVRSAWSTVFQVPDAAHVAEQVRGYAVCRSLLDRGRHELDGPPEEVVSRRAWVEGALRRLAELAGRTPNPFAAMLFFAGLAATHRAGNPLYLEQRLAANGVCTTATDPLDPVFRLSVLVFRLLGDPVIAAQRARALAATDDEPLRRWLGRVDDVEPLG